ncbi:MAG: hypothetical protein HZA22_02335 [Nitrospirae bacterium]|nr:hypothetical protein [Nitrospirota bacterium]
MRFLAGVAALFSFVIVLGACAPAFAGEKSLGAALAEALHTKGVIDDATYADVTKGGSDEEISRRLLEALHKKGVVDDATYKEVSAVDCEPKPVSLAAAPQSTPAPAATGAEAPVRDSVKPLDTALSSVEEGIARLGGDKVKMKIGFFFQGGWVNDDAGFSVGAPPTTDVGAGNQFFVRRARVFFDGTVLEKIGYKLSMEAATSASVLRDAYVYLDYIPYARLTVGQFKVPFGLEGVEALASNPTINRSMVTNFVHAPTVRDRGIMASGSYKTTLGDRPFGASYDLAVVGGNSFNRADDNEDKDVSLRVRVTPLVKGMTVGGSLYAGKTHNAAGDKDRDRYAAEFDFNPAAVKGLKLRGEYMWDRKFFDNYAAARTGAKGAALGRALHTSGWYVLAAYRVDGAGGGLKFLNGLEPLVRYERMDEDASIPDNERSKTTVGFNYYLAKDTRIMANYEFVQADDKLALRSVNQLDTKDHNLFTTQIQLKF